MKFTVNSVALKKAHASVARVISSKTALPILENILFSPVDDSKIRLIASDIDNTVSVTCDIKDASDVEAFLVPNAFLSSLMSALGATDLSFEYDGSNGELTICDDSIKGKWNIITDTNVLEFPTVKAQNDAVSFVIDVASLLESTANASVFVASGNMRPIMCCVNYAIEGDVLRISSSNGQFLYMDRLSGLKDNGADGRSVNIADKLVKCLSAIVECEKAGDVKVTFDKSSVRFERGDVFVVGQLVDGKYPRVESVIPKNNDKLVCVDRKKLCSLIKQATICGNPNKQVKITFGPMFYSIEAEDIDFSRSSSVTGEVVEAKNVTGDVLIAFNSEMLMTIASVYRGSENVWFYLSEATRPAIIKANEESSRLILLMPMQLK